MSGLDKFTEVEKQPSGNLEFANNEDLNKVVEKLPGEGEPEKDDELEHILFGMNKLGKTEEQIKELENPVEPEKPKDENDTSLKFEDETKEKTPEELAKEKEIKESEGEPIKLEFDDITSFAKEIGLEGEFKTKEEFKTALKDFTEKSKQVIEYDLSKHDKETQELINFLNNGGTRADFIEPLKKYDDFLFLSEDKKIEIVLKYSDKMSDEQIKEYLSDENVAKDDLIDYFVNEEKTTKAQAAEKIQELEDNDKLLPFWKSKLAETFSNEIKESRTKEYNKVIEQYNEKVKTLQSKDISQSVEEKKQLSDYILKQEKFNDLEIPEPTRQRIVKEIESGEFYKRLNNPEALYKAYMNSIFSKQLDEQQKKLLKEENRKGYNTGLQSKDKFIHNKAELDLATGINKELSKDTHPLSKWKEITGGDN